MGGALLQNINRDTQKYAIKCSEATINGVAMPVFKQSPGKHSLKGRFKVKQSPFDNAPSTVNEDALGFNLLQTVFENGKILKEYTFDEVRRNVKDHWEYI